MIYESPKWGKIGLELLESDGKLKCMFEIDGKKMIGHIHLQLSSNSFLVSDNATFLSYVITDSEILFIETED